MAYVFVLFVYYITNGNEICIECILHSVSLNGCPNDEKITRYSIHFLKNNILFVQFLNISLREKNVYHFKI